MGILSKVKKTIVGGDIDFDLYIVQNPVQLGEDLTVRVQARVGAEPVDIRGVVLQVRGIETVEIQWPEVEALGAQQPRHTNTWNRFTLEEKTFTKKVKIQNATTLKPKGDYVWEGTVALPSNGTPTIQARRFKHMWTVHVVIKSGLLSKKATEEIDVFAP